LVATLLGPGLPCRGIVHLWSLDADTADDMTADALECGALLGCESALHLTQALATAASHGTMRLWLVTRGAQPVDGSPEPIVLTQTPLWGLAKAIAFELPDLTCTCVDLPPRDGADEVDALFRQLLGDDAESCALRGGKRYVARLVGYAPNGARNGRLTIDPGGTHLVTGGLGALGLAVARWLVDRGARSIVLVGRGGPSAGATATVEALRARGARVEVMRGDAGRAEDIAAILGAIRERLPALCGIVHAAGVIDDGALLDLDARRLRSVMAPKLRGAWNLHIQTAGLSLDYFVLFSSAASVLGSPGQGNYIAANAFLDALAHHRRAHGLPALTINWGPWAEIGLAADTAAGGPAELTKAHLLTLIPPERGLGIFGRLLEAEPTQVAVLPYDLRNLMQFYPVRAGIAFFDEILGVDVATLRSVGTSSRLYARPDLEQEYAEPRNELERTIAGLWQRALDVDRVGVHDAFFELGGDSVVAGQILSRVNRTFGVAINPEGAFDRFTVENLARLVEEALLDKVEEFGEGEAHELLSADA